MAIGAISSILPEIFKLTQGAQDKNLGQQYLRTARPQLRVPSEVWRAYNRMQNISNAPIPGEGYAREDLQEGVSSGVRALKELSSPGEANAGAIGLYGAEIDAKRRMASENAGLRREGQMNLANFETGTLASYKDKMFDVNRFQPYQDAQAAARALLSSGEQNKFNGLTGFSRVGVGLSSMLGDQSLSQPNKTGDVNLDAFFGGNVGGEVGSTGANNPNWDSSGGYSGGFRMPASIFGTKY